MDEWSYTVGGATISLVPSGREVQFDREIVEHFAIGNMVVVRTDNNQLLTNENVYGVSAEHGLAWQIAAIPHAYKVSPYVWIGKSGDALFATNWDGDRVQIEPNSGAIMSVSEGR